MFSSLLLTQTRTGRCSQAIPTTNKPPHLNTLSNADRGGGVESAYYLLELGLVYRDDNQLERAETILQEARQITVADQIPDLHGALLHAWGETLRLRGRLDEAEPSLLEGLEIMSSIFGKEHDLTREVAGSLSQLYAARGQTTETQYYSQMAGADEHP